MIMKGNNLTVAIGNQKGGVGKTTSTACIGAAPPCKEDEYC